MIMLAETEGITPTHLGVGISNGAESTYPDHLPMTIARHDVEVRHGGKGWGRRLS